MDRAAVIIEYLGGTSAVQRGLGHKYPTTVQGWKTRGKIPMEHVPALLKFAKRCRKPLTHTDFFPDQPLSFKLNEAAE